MGLITEGPIYYSLGSPCPLGSCAEREPKLTVEL